MKTPLLAVLLVAVIAFTVPAYTAMAATSDIQHPKVWAEGTVTKDIYVGYSVFEYSVGELSETMPFTLGGNISIPVDRVEFEQDLLNTTTTDVTFKSNWQGSVELLSNSYGLPYILFRAQNSSTVGANTFQDNIIVLKQEVDVPISNDYYVIVTAKCVAEEGLVDDVFTSLVLVFLDEGGEKRAVELYFNTASGTDGVTSVNINTPEGTIPGISVRRYSVTDYTTIQVKLSDIIEQAGLNWILGKLVRIYYKLASHIADTESSSYLLKAFYRHVILSPYAIYVKDSSHLFDGTQVVWQESWGDVLTIKDAVKVYHVDIPFRYEPSPEVATAGSDGFTYKWEFMLPEPADEGDQFTFSDTKLIMRSWFDGSYYDYLYVAGANKLSDINTLEVSEDTGYWEKELLTGLNEGYKYDVEAKVSGLPEDVFMSLTAPAAWWNPKSWAYRILMFLYTLLSIFGIKATSVKKTAMRYRVPKR